jgi:rod shape determining protein RodA
MVAAVATLVLVIAPLVGHPVLQGYQQSRLTSFLNPSQDPRSSSYQINQSLIAVGSGGKTGRGGQATQAENGFLPERNTDFIFAVVGERFGFVGAAFVLSLYALLIWRALRITTLSKNLYGSMIAGGIAAMLMFHVFVNVGITIGIMPITGIPLPLMSFGGSSVVVTLMAIGLLQSVYVQARLTSKSGAPAPGHG